jgi:xylitol oxidase
VVITNWAGNVTFSARRLHRPASVAEVRELVAGADKLRVLGSGHSFNHIADTTGDLLSLADLPPVISFSGDTVTVSAGLRYGEVVPQLHAAGYALHNLGSLPHISIAGACATGTHGSGVGNGTLASAVVALDLVTADGSLLTVERGDDLFPAAVVGLGALGVVTSLTLALRPAFDVAQYVYDDLPHSAALDGFDDIMTSGYSVSLFTDWAGSRFNQVWVKQLAGGGAAPERWHGATLADGPRHPVPGMSAEHCTSQMGEPGPWHARLPHFRLEFTPSSGEELQSEYFVPRERAAEAVVVLRGLGPLIAPLLQIAEVRTIAADELWLSPAYRQQTVGLHFTWLKDWPGVRELLPQIEARLAPLGARPHWGKLFTMDPAELQPRYERLPDFRALAERYDPQGKLRNPFVDTYIFAGRAPA